MMNNWIPFSDGEYLVERALLAAGERNAVVIEDPVVEVYSDQTGQRYLRGRGRVRNMLMVELLEDSEDLDLLLDFGDEFKYFLKSPRLQSGKVFSPDVRSALQFIPKSPWHQLEVHEFEALVSQLRILSHL